MKSQLARVKRKKAPSSAHRRRTCNKAADFARRSAAPPGLRKRSANANANANALQSQQEQEAGTVAVAEQSGASRNPIENPIGIRTPYWLETHVWHARRAHMTDRWRRRLVLQPTEKCFRACHRAAHRDGALLIVRIDASVHPTISIYIYYPLLCSRICPI